MYKTKKIVTSSHYTPKERTFPEMLGWRGDIVTKFVYMFYAFPDVYASTYF